uniref:Uncharacterized protein n=1 Tax=Anguilla anguilla TaxID=7936 RepID=A0A0E9WAI8_ANGAN
MNGSAKTGGFTLFLGSTLCIPPPHPSPICMDVFFWVFFVFVFWEVTGSTQAL